MANTNPAPSLRVLRNRIKDRLAVVTAAVQTRINRYVDGPEGNHDPAELPKDLDDIISQPPTPLLRSAFLCTVILVATLLALAGISRVDVVVTGQGRLITDTPPVVLQPLERAIIRELLVKNGDRVQEGQLLALLDPTFSEADKESLTVQQRSLLAQLRRLEAEAHTRIFDIRNGMDPEETLQLTLYKQRKAYYAARLAVFDGEMKRLETTLSSAQTDKGLLSKQLEIARELESMRGSLLQSQTGSRLQHMESQSTRMRAEREFVDAQNRILELQNQIQSRRAERQSFIEDWQRQVIEELVKVRTEASRVSENLVKASLMRNLVEVVAPEDGIVLERARRSVGSFIGAGEPLVTLVAANVPLIAEIRIPSSQVGFAKPGDEAIIKVDAFPYLKNGNLEGRLRSISQESFPMPEAPNSSRMNKAQGNGYHRAELEITSLKLENLAPGVTVTPGMTVTAEISVGSRSVLSNMIAPLLRGVMESMREP